MATALQTIQEQVSAEEWRVRQDLAALYRLVAMIDKAERHDPSFQN